jgi:hypothetical protein
MAGVVKTTGMTKGSATTPRLLQDLITVGKRARRNLIKTATNTAQSIVIGIGIADTILHTDFTQHFEMRVSHPGTSPYM